MIRQKSQSVVKLAVDAFDRAQRAIMANERSAFDEARREHEAAVALFHRIREGSTVQ